MTLSLPLPHADLPAAIQRFCNPEGPAGPRLMAAKGLVPVKGPDLVTLLVQLSADADEKVAAAATTTLKGLPAAILVQACAEPLPPAVLDRLSTIVQGQEALSALLSNRAVDNQTVETLARQGDEALCELIAVNQARLLQAPHIIEALYKNRCTRMSTADRLIELAARNGLTLSGIPGFQAHVEALQGELIPEPSDEPLPQDEAFAQTLADDSDEPAFERDKFSGTEAMKPQFKPLSMQIMDMTKAEKLRLALIGNAAARAILVRDNNKQIAFAAVSSPQMTLAEACEVARSREVSEELLRYIANKKDWIRSGEVKHNLVFNPKTPVALSIRFLGHLRLDELRQLARNRNISGQLRSLAGQWVQRKSTR